MKTPRQKLIKKLDDLVRKIVLERDKKCVRCGSQSNLQLSHVDSRANMGLRWDPLNLKILCVGCHLYWWHKEVRKAGEWFKDKYPERAKYLEEKEHEVRSYKVYELEELYEQLKSTSNS